MTMELPPNPADWLDLYVDGLLDESQKARFEQEMSANPELRAAVDLQRKLDDSIKAAFPYVQPAPIAGRIGRHDGEPARVTPESTFRRLRWYAAAAAVLIGAALYTNYVTTPPGSDIRYMEPSALYARLEAIGFVPEFVCKTDAEFVAAVHKRLGSGLLVAQAPGLELLGWAYGNDYNGRIVGKDTMVLMCRLDGNENVVVLMDKLADDRNLKLPADSKLSLFRREVGRLVLYEITPDKQQRVLPLAKPARVEDFPQVALPTGG